MLWIEAALAFAITMMILSTIISAIIEIGHRLFRVREHGLQKLISNLHSNVISSAVPAGNQSSTAEFVQRMTASNFVANKTLSISDRIINAPQLTKLSTAEFIGRLANTKEGQALYSSNEHNSEQGSDKLKILLAYITNHFDSIGNGATDYFKRRAALYSLALGLVMAFSFNINAPHLLQAFLTDKDSHLIMQEKIQNLDELLKQQSTSLEINEVRTAIQDLQADQLPFGWSSAPWYRSDWHSQEQTLTVMLWALTMLFSGVLIGLGGPFWFDTYRKLGILAGLRKSDMEDGNIEMGLTQECLDEWLALFKNTIKASQMMNPAEG